MTEILTFVCVFAAGLSAGFLNVMAGGGSAITLGVLILLGFDSSVANGTNRIALFAQNISAVTSFRREKYSEFPLSLKLSLFTLPGAILGSIYAVNISHVMFQRILAVVMIFVLATLLLPKSRNNVSGDRGKTARLLVYPAMFGVGFYGGFVQAGVGFIIMAALRHLMGLDLVRVNMHKVFVVLIYTIPILFVFGLTGNINWVYAICLAAGNAVGAWWSAKVSVVKGEKAVKAVLYIALGMMAVKFFLAS
jgi:uncharacterized membrane protein YfcA